MKLKFRSDHADIHLGKVVVSIFPGQPVEGKVTLDIEILRASAGSILVSTDCKGAVEKASELTPVPYADNEDPLRSYLGETYNKFSDELHLDKTGDQLHVVAHGNTALERTAESDGDYDTVWRLSGDAGQNGVGELVKKFTEPGNPETEIEGCKMIGDWIRIVRDWPESNAGGMIEQVGFTFEAEGITCEGLYIWYFTPDAYKFKLRSDTLTVWRDGDSSEKSKRLNFESTDASQFAEFEIWRGWVNGRSLATNKDRIDWSSSELRTRLQAGLTSPKLRRKARRESFAFGALIAFFASAAIQTVGMLLGQPGETLSFWWFVAAAATFFAATVGLGYYGWRWGV